MVLAYSVFALFADHGTFQRNDCHKQIYVFGERTTTYSLMSLKLSNLTGSETDLAGLREFQKLLRHE